MKVVNLPVLAKNGSVSRTAKPKSTKRWDNSSMTCSDIVPYGGGLPLIGNIVLVSSPPPFACTCSSRRSTASKPDVHEIYIIKYSHICIFGHTFKLSCD